MQRITKPSPATVRTLAILGSFLLVSAAAAKVLPNREVPLLPPARDSLPSADSSLDTVGGARPLASLLDTMRLLPFQAKRDGRVGAYRLGYWPAERGPIPSAAYANPAGFLEVTPQNQDTYVSPHFQLRDFLTHDQGSVWPKYVVLREPLIQKLEYVIADLQAHGVRVQHLQVMSGFRTPEYNALGVGEGGRVSNSRHQYGDAADVFVDNNGDRRMDDLNGDGRVTAADDQVIVQAVDRVERQHPELVGGAGIYHSTGAHGPFVHIDARGKRARWGNA
jgi:hypothetical protein